MGGGAATVFSMPDILKLHRDFVSKGQFRRLGRMVKIVLSEIPRDVPLTIGQRELLTEGRTLDWFGQGPMIGLSQGDVDLLVVSPVTPLPDKPDPEWKQPYFTQQEIEAACAKDPEGRWRPPQAPLVPQRPEDRGAVRVKGTNILSFEPVHEILFRPVGLNVWGCVKCLTDPGSGTKVSFLWDFDTGFGYFYGGRFLVQI